MERRGSLRLKSQVLSQEADPPDRLVENRRDQVAIADPVKAAQQHDVTGRGVEAGERVDLEKVDHATTVAAQIDAAAIATAQRAPGAERDTRGLGGDLAVGARVGDAALVVHLVVSRVDASLGERRQTDLHDPEHAGRGADAGDADGELASGQILLDSTAWP